MTIRNDIRSSRSTPEPGPPSPSRLRDDSAHVRPVTGVGPDDRMEPGQIAEVAAAANRLALRLLEYQSENDWIPDAIADPKGADEVEEALRIHLQGDLRRSFASFRAAARRRLRPPDQTWPEDA